MPMRYVTITAIALSLLIVFGATHLRGSGQSSPQPSAGLVKTLPTVQIEQDEALVTTVEIVRSSELLAVPGVPTYAVPVETSVPSWTDDRDHDDGHKDDHDDDRDHHDHDDEEHDDHDD